MKQKRNEFTNPWIIDLEYLLLKLRRNDLRLLIEKHLPKSRDAVVLDFGARRSPYQAMFTDKVKKFLTADLMNGQKPSQFDVAIGSDGLLHQQPPESVDVVLSLQVLEHVKDVDTYLSEANRVLKPKGLLWLTTHGMWPYHATPDDYHRWTMPGLHKAIEPYFTVLDSDFMMGGPAYAIIIYIHLLWEACLKLNAIQAKFLNAITGSKRWGKTEKGNKKIKNPYLYLGSVLFHILVIPLNLIMSIMEYMTPLKIKKKEAAVFRIACRKKD